MPLNTTRRGTLALRLRWHVQALILVAAALLPAGMLRADTITLKTDSGTSQVDGTVESVDAVDLVYIALATDRRTHKPIESVVQIKAFAEPELTAAEQAYADGKWADAVTKYRRAMTFSTSDWAKYRAIVRLIDAAGKCQQFEAQVAAFIELAKLDPANTKGHLPEMAGAKPEQLNAVLEGLDRAANSPDLKKESTGVLKQFLATVYLARGDTANAAKVLGGDAAAAPRALVHDNAGKFSKEAIEKAEATIGQLRSKYDHELMIETFADIPEAKRDDVLAKGAERFFQDWNAERRKVEGIDGVVVLICMDPLRIQIGVASEDQEALFTPADRDELLRHLTDSIHDHQFDTALTSTASFVFKTYEEHTPKDAAALFKVPADASQIVFVCDASGSMLNKMATLKNELQKAVGALGPSQTFNIIFFQDEKCVALDDKKLVTASPEVKRNAYKFLDDVTTSGTTDPIPGLTLAFKQHPQLIYLLTDGDFPDNKLVKDTIAKLDADHKVKVNTIAFVNDQDTDTDYLEFLKEIAEANGGRFRHVAEDKLNQ